MKHIVISSVAAVLLLFSATASAQNLKKANKEFELHAFNLAIKSYRAVLNKEPNNAEALFKMGESYRHLNQISQANEWYQKAVNQATVNPKAYYGYGLSLMNQGQYDSAKEQFLKYAETNPYVGAHYAENCDYAKSLQGVPALYRVKKEYLNKSASDFGAAFFGDYVVYSSARSDMTREDGKSKENWTGRAKNQLFITDTDDNGYLRQPDFLRSTYKSNYNEGPVSYSVDGNWVVFTKNNFVNGTRQIPSSGTQLSLYIAEVSNLGDWQNPKAFPFNGSGYSTGYGFINADGTRIYFASDRPDGYGGFDIYVTTKTGSSWSSPTNLGPVVNSPGNEITPFIENGTLYFASDWHQGLGGFDLFKSEFSNGNWNRIFHLGNTINSNRDDYGLVFNGTKNIGYFTSNRLGGKGNEDLYQFSQLSDNIVISVKNVRDNSPIPNATIDFSACGESAFSTNAKGEYSFQALPGLDCEGVVFKDGYNSYSFKVTSDGRKKSQVIEVFLTREADKFLGRIIDPRDNSSVSDVFVRATNQENGSKLETRSDEKGEYRLALLPDKTYVIRYSKVGFTDTHQRISTGNGSNKGMLGTVDLYPSSTSVGGGTLISSSMDEVTEPETKTESGVIPELLEETRGGTPPVDRGNATVNENRTPALEEQPDSYDTNTYVQKGFAVQLAAMGLNQKVNPLEYDALKSLGNIYSRPESGFKKLRVGIFESEEEAKEARKEIAKAGFKKAFIVNEVLDDTEGLEVYSMVESEEETEVPTKEPVVDDTPAPEPEMETATGSTEYLVRLAAYKNPQYFKASRVSDLGVIEQQRSGAFTIMYIAGFSTLDKAEDAREKAKTSGFKGAYIVENVDGEYVKVEM